MTKEKAHNSVTLKFDAGLISLEEAQSSHRHIDMIGTGFRNGHRLSAKQQSALYAVWAN